MPNINTQKSKNTINIKTNCFAIWQVCKMKKYLNFNGLKIVWAKIKSVFATKAEVDKKQIKMISIN